MLGPYGPFALERLSIALQRVALTLLVLLENGESLGEIGIGLRTLRECGDIVIVVIEISVGIYTLVAARCIESHIVKVVIYLTDIRYREAVYRAMGKWLKGVFPVSTGLVVQALARPEWVVEIDATAVIPDGYKPKRKAKK